MSLTVAAEMGPAAFNTSNHTERLTVQICIGSNHSTFFLIDIPHITHPPPRHFFCSLQPPQGGETQPGPAQLDRILSSAELNRDYDNLVAINRLLFFISVSDDTHRPFISLGYDFFRVFCFVCQQEHR